jgi:ferritin-like metal-binding protein YciE
MKIENLEQFYVEELRDLYDAEKQLLRALPRMAKAASHDELKSTFQEHAEQTQEQLNRLERILDKHGKNGRGKKCKAMMGLIEEGKEMMDEKPTANIMDVGLITTAQKVEHYEIAGYGCMSTYAKLLGLRDEADLLHKTLQEEKETDGKLTKLAKSIVNPEAEEEEGDMDQEPASASRTQTRDAGRSTQKKSSSSSRSRSSTAKKSSNSGRPRSKSKSNGSQGRDEHAADGEAIPTKDLEQIKAWAEARGGKPVHVKGTGSGKDPGLLRIDFPGYSGGQSLEPISWEEWYQKFQDNNLTFLYQDKTKDGKESRFFKLVCMEAEKSTR